MDGLQLECKKSTKEERNNKRKNYETRYDEYLPEKYEDEDPAQIAVYQKYSEEISRENYYMFIDFLKHKKVKYMIAPYEADSQLAYLYHTRTIEYILTEDSDLVAYGCYNIIRNLKKNGDCRILNIYKTLPENVNKNLEFFSEMNNDSIVKCCILSGCDYLPNIKGLGFISLLKIFQKPNTAIKNIYNHVVIKRKQMNNKEFDEYMQEFEKVYSTFTEQLVYCNYREKIVHLSAWKNIKNRSIIKTLDPKYVGYPIMNEKEFIIGNTNFDDTSKKRQAVNIDFDRILKFFQYTPDFKTGRIGNLTLELITFNNFDKNNNDVKANFTQEVDLKKRDFESFSQIKMDSSKYNDNITADTLVNISLMSEVSENKSSIQN